MPFVDPTLEEDDDNKSGSSSADSSDSSQPASQSQSSPQAPILGQSAGLNSGSGNGKPSAAAQPASSGQFTNLQDYLGANAGSDFGNQVAGKVQSDVDKANSSQTAAGSTFKGDVDSGTTNYDANLVNNTVDNASTAVNGPADQLNKFYAQRDATYSGPQSFADDANAYGGAYTDTQNAQQEAAAGQTEDGRRTLLNQFYAQPTYGYGQQSLDNLILQNDPNSQQAFQNVNQNAGQAATNFQDLSNNLNNYATQGAANTAATQANTRAAITDAASGIDTSLNNNVAAYNANLPTLYSQYLGDLQAGKAPSAIFNQLSNPSTTVSSDIARQGGIANPTGNFNTYGVDPTQYLSQGAQATDANMITPDQKAQLSALMQLGGSQVIDPNSYSYVNSNTPALDTSNPVNFNAANFLAAVKNNQNAYNTGMNQSYQGFDNLTDAQKGVQSRIAQIQNAPKTGGGVYNSNSDLAANQQSLAQINALINGLTTKYNPNSQLSLQQ